jgi:hypothetical protein
VCLCGHAAFPSKSCTFFHWPPAISTTLQMFHSGVRTVWVAIGKGQRLALHKIYARVYVRPAVEKWWGLCHDPVPFPWRFYILVRVELCHICRCRSALSSDIRVGVELWHTTPSFTNLLLTSGLRYLSKNSSFCPLRHVDTYIFRYFKSGRVVKFVWNLNNFVGN